jgi:hypothetical protein
LQRGQPTEAFRQYFAELDGAIDGTLIPALRDAGVLLPEKIYEAAGVETSLRLASIPDFNTLIANSQQARKPVFALTQDDVNRRGFVWETQKVNIASFREIFTSLAERVEILTRD